MLWKIFSMLWNLALQEQAKFVNHKYDIWNCGSWPEIKSFGRFGLKIAMCLIFMKFGNQSQSNMLIYEYINWNWWPWPKIRSLWNLVPRLKFLWNLVLELIMNWNWWSWPKIVDSDKYGPNIEIRFDFYEIWHSQKIEHTFYNVILASV